MENVLFLQFLEHPAKTFGTISSGKIRAMISMKCNARCVFDYRTEVTQTETAVSD